MIPIPLAPTVKIELILELAFLRVKKLPEPIICKPAPVVIVPPSWYIALPLVPLNLIVAVPVAPKSTSPPFK